MFEAYNESGSLQVSANTFTFSFVQKGSFTVQNRYFDVDGFPVFEGTFGRANVSFVPDMVVFSCAQRAIIGDFAEDVTSPGNGVITASSTTYDDSVVGTGTCNWWAFRKSQFISAPSNFGMQLFDATGTLIYSAADHNPLRIIQTASGTSPSSSWVGTHTLPTGRTYGVARFGSSPSSSTYPIGAKVNSNVVTLENIVHEGESVFGNWGLASGYGGFLFADVTGY